MPLPPALLAKLQKRGIIKDEKKAKDEEVYIENYDSDQEQDDDEEISDRDNERGGAPGCPNKWNPYHVCVDFCWDHWQEGMPENRLPDRYHHARRQMLARYKLPEGWREVYDAGVRRHYYWCPATDEVCWLSPLHPLAVIGEAAPIVAKRNRDSMQPGQRPVHNTRILRISDASSSRYQAPPQIERQRQREDTDMDDEQTATWSKAPAPSRNASQSALAVRQREAAPAEMSDRERLKLAKRRGIDPMDPAAYSDISP